MPTPNLPEPVWVAIISALGIALGAIISSGTQLFRWNTGEKSNNQSQAVETYAKTALTAADTTSKLLVQINQLRDDLNKALSRIETLETEKEAQEARLEEQNQRILKLEAEKADLQERVQELETENAELRRNKKNRKGLATTA